MGAAHPFGHTTSGQRPATSRARCEHRGGHHRAVRVDLFEGHRGSAIRARPLSASGYEAAERAFCVTGAGAVRSRGVTTRKAPRVVAFFMRSWRDTFLAGAADATMRLIEVTGVVHDVPLHGFVTGGYTRDAGAEPGSRCKSDTVLATVTRELGPTSPPGPPAWEGGMRALDLGVRRPPASSCSADPREREGLCRPIMPALIVRDAAATRCRGWHRVLRSKSDCLLSRGITRPLHHRGAIHDRVHP